jgi:YVTN family beta-propeller protein
MFESCRAHGSTQAVWRELSGKRLEERGVVCQAWHRAMPELPRGAVTFLFTDMEGSTRLLKQLRDRYGDVLTEHGRLLRDAFARHGGHVVDTQGDSFFVAFASGREAVLAAVEAQRAIAEHDWPEGTDVRVRIGIHTGQAAASDKRYVGLAVHRAARISAAGHGGQVLVSQTTHNLLDDEEQELPGVGLLDLGPQQLKDLDRPVRLFQVTARGLRSAFPPLRTQAPALATAPTYRRRRTILVGALAGVIAAAIAIPLFALGGDGASRANLDDTQGNIVGVLDAGSGAVRAAVELPAPPTAVAAGLGLVWAASADSNAVYAIDPDTNSRRDTIEVGNAPGGIAVGGGYVWVTNSLAGTVSQISPKGQVLEEITVGNGPTGVAVRGGYVWVVNTTDHTVSKIRASDGKRLKSYPAGTDPGAVAVGERAVWIASKSGGYVIKLNPGDGQPLDTIPVGQGPAAIAVGLGSVWVANSADGTLTQIDPDTNSVRATIPVGAGPSGIAIVRDEVWTANELASTISRIHPATRLATTVRLGRRPTSLAAGDGIVYVAPQPTGTAHRGGTLTAALASFEPLKTVDPAVGSLSSLWRFASLTNNGLLTYRHLGGQAGNQLVPDLARSMPNVSDDGKTYTFQLRRNIHYSNGRLVRASDFRYAIERVFKLRPHPDPYSEEIFRGIRGADRCNRRRCDLSAGIVADDAARTVKFNLAAPDPDFLFKLVFSQAAAVPTGASLREAKRRPLPATGPYRIASFTRDSVRLVRNPHFREWSEAAQPTGFPDEIVLKTVPTKEGIALVERGKADLTSSVPLEPFPVASRFLDWVHVHPIPATLYLVLDTERPPFANPKARQAVNYALDRNKVVQLATEENAGRPTCQVLPPNFPGYRRYCPYTLDPGADGAWTAPDSAKAAQLVKASGTRGAPVTLWVDSDFAGRRVGPYLKQVLERLGYRAQLRSSWEGTPLNYFVQLEGGAMSHRDGPRVAYGAWRADYPAASQFIQTLFSCRSTANYPRSCDPALERRIGRAAKLEQTDRLGAANRLWAELDRVITDKAMWVPLYNPYGADLVSKRIGHYQYNPQMGALLSQLWVR